MDVNPSSRRQDLVDELAERKLKHVEVARRMGVHSKHLSKLLNGERPWTLRTARDFSFATGIALRKVLPAEES
jgi:plasmid maintenance system antidote protein VapI